MAQAQEADPLPYNTSAKPPHFRVARLIVPAIAAGLTYHAHNQLLLCSIRGLTEQRHPWELGYTEYC